MHGIQNTSDSGKKKKVFLFLALLTFALTAAVRCAFFASELYRFCDILGFSRADAVLLWGFEMALMLSMCAFSALMVYRLLFKKIAWHRFFAALTLGFGLIFLLTITPLSVPDEITHFHAICELSGKLLSRGVSSDYNDLSGFANHQNVCTGYLRVLHDFGGRAAEGELRELGVLSGMWTLTYFVEYIPQTLGVALAMLFERNAVTAFLLGRLFNLLFYVLCVYFAVKRTPKGKLMFGLAALMPMALQQAASLSYDNFINALSLLLLASLLKAIFAEEPLCGKDLLCIFLPAILLAPAKGVYSLFVLLFLFVPKEKFSALRLKKGGIFALLLGSCAAFFALVSVPSLVRILNGTRPGFEVTGDSQYSLSFILSNPLEAYRIFADSFNIYILQWLGGAIGFSLSTYSLDLPSWLVPLYAALLILSVQNSPREKISLPTGMRPTLLAISATVIFAFMMTMFLTWIRSTDKIIIGVQGRYFIPIIPLLLLSLCNRSVELKKDLSRPLTVLAVLLLCRTVLEIFTQTMFASV